MFWLAVGNVGFFVFHTALILFNLFGWMSRKTRKWQLITLGLTACSWFVFGFWRGWGYCLCTDWHMQIRRAMGIHDESRMYVQLMVQTLTGWRPSDDATMWITGGGFVFGLVMGVVSSWREARSEKREARGEKREARGEKREARSEGIDD